MNNYPGYSHPHSSSLFPAYERQPTSPNNVALESLRQQLYESNDRFQINTDLSQNQLKSPTTSYPLIKNPQLPRDGHNINGDSPIYRRENNARYDFEKEQDLLRSQGFSQSDRRNPSNFHTGDPVANASRAEAHQSHDIHSDYLRRSFLGERISPYDDYNNRERLSQRLASDNETRIQREQVFNRFPDEVNSYHNNFPSRYIGPPVCDYPDSSSLRSQSLVQDGLYGGIPTTSIRPALSREEEILKEIKALQQQQKLQELLNVSLSLAKHMKPSAVLEDFNRQSLSNNTSSSIPDTLINKGLSNEVFLNERHDTDIFPKSKPFISPNSNPNGSVNPTLDEACNISINVSKSTELKDSPETEKVCISSESSPNTLISGSKIASHESSEQSCSIPFDSVNNKGLNKELNTSSPSKSIVSGDNSSISEWPLSNSIPFLGETTDNRTFVNELGLKSPASQKLEQASNLASVQNHKECGGSNKVIKSNLEDALKTLEIVDPVVGLDFIIENKSNVSVDGSFPFYCELCNSSITRSLIIDHILSYKHRIRFVKIKDEGLYEHILSHKVKQCEKEEEVYKAAEMLENKYGRGRVVVQNLVSTKDAKKRPPIKINFRKVHDSPKPSAFELNNEIDLEQRKFSDDVNPKKENSISPDGMDIASPTETPPPIPKPPHPVSSHVNSNNEFCKQVSPIKSESTHVPVKNESLIVTTSLKHDTKQQVTVDSLLSSKFNINDAVFSKVISALKRPASPLGTMLQKRVKTEEGSGETEIKSLSSDISLHKDSDLGNSPFVSQSASQLKEEKTSLTELLQHMTKWEISNNEEAEMISKTVDVLLKLLLHYKLRQEPSDEMEKLMKSFLSSHLEKSHMNSNMTENIEQFVENKESISSKVNKNVTAPMEIIENKNSIKTDSRQSSPPQEVSKTALNPDIVSPAVSTSQASNAAFLQPPPFFCWPKSSVPPTSTTTSHPEAKAETNWSSQYTAALYAYPQQGYVGVPSMYQPYALPIAHCVAPMPIQMALPAAASMTPIPPPPKSTPPPPNSIPPPPKSSPPQHILSPSKSALPPLPSMKEPSLPPPPPPLPPSCKSVLPLPQSGLSVVHPPPPPPPPVGGLPVPPLPPSTDGPPMPPLPPSVNRPPLPP